MQEYSQDILELWEQINEEAQEIIEREALLEDLVDDVVLKSNNIFEAISKRMARKLGQNAIYEENLVKLFNKIFIKYEPIGNELILKLNSIAKEDKLYSSPTKVLLYSRTFQILATKAMVKLLLENNKEDIALYIKGLAPLD